LIVVIHRVVSASHDPTTADATTLMALRLRRLSSISCIPLLRRVLLSNREALLEPKHDLADTQHLMWNAAGISP
jgi:hypothetical protein